jgi:hypothetical protein
VIEGGFSSHINQPFDREVAKRGKHEMKSAIALLQRRRRASKNRMCLVSSGLATTRHLATPSPQGACPQGGHPGRRRERALTTESSP